MAYTNGWTDSFTVEDATLWSAWSSWTAVVDANYGPVGQHRIRTMNLGTGQVAVQVQEKLAKGEYNSNGASVSCKYICKTSSVSYTSQRNRTVYTDYTTYTEYCIIEATVDDTITVSGTYYPGTKSITNTVPSSSLYLSSGPWIYKDSTWNQVKGAWIYKNNTWNQVKQIKRYDTTARDLDDFKWGYYQECSYIQTSGTQYINTGLKTGGVNGVDVTFEPTAGSTGTANNIVFSATSSIPFGIKSLSSPKTTYRCYYYGSTAGNATGCTGQTNIVINNGVVTLNGSQLSTYTNKSYSYSTTTTVLYIGKLYNTSYASKVKYYRFKFYGTDNTTLVADYIPALRISDKRAGFYDLVTNTFFGNAGTGSFGYCTLDGTAVDPV